MLAGAKAVVFGVANKYSVAWGVAQAWSAAGAEVAFIVQSERFVRPVRALVQTWPTPPPTILAADVTSDAELDAVFAELGSSSPGDAPQAGGRIDAVLHSVAHAPRSALGPTLSSVSRQDFASTLDVSVYSLVAIARRAAPLMRAGGSITTMSFVGGDRVVPAYGLMGPAKACLQSTAQYLAAELGPQRIRVNCVSAGPISTAAARGIPGFQELRAAHTTKAPLQRDVTTSDVGAVCTFLASPAAANVTGQILYVDGGGHIML